MDKGRIERSKTTLFAGIFLNGVISVCSFGVRAILIRYIGIEYTGISGLFASILQIFNLADLGVDAAATSLLYKPVARMEYEKINCIMRLIRRYYIAIGIFIGTIGLAAVPIIPNLIYGKAYPDGLNIYLIYFFYVLNSSLSYLMAGYYHPLYLASKYAYMASIISGSSIAIMYILQIISLIICRNYYIFTAIMVVNVLIQAAFYSFRNKRDFTYLNFKGRLLPENNKALLKSIYASGISKVRNVTRYSLDSVFISYFLGLRILAEYQNYYQIILLALTVLSLIHGAFTVGFGNGLALESAESNYETLKTYTLAQNIVVTIMCSIMLATYQPFISIWVGEEYVMGYEVVLLLCIYFFVLSIADTSMILRESTGIWWSGRRIAVIEMIANIILNYLLVRMFGIIGVMLSTIIVIMLITIPFEYGYVFKETFPGKYVDYFFEIGKNTLSSILVIGLCIAIICHIPDYGLAPLIIRLLLSGILATFLSVAIHCRDRSFPALIDLVKIIISRE